MFKLDEEDENTAEVLVYQSRTNLITEERSKAKIDFILNKT